MTPLSVGKRIRADMVRRVDTAPRLVDPMGLPARTDTMNTTATAPPGASLRRRTATIEEPPAAERLRPAGEEVGFGGFPGPREILQRTSERLMPQLHRRLQQSLTIPRTATLVPQVVPSVDPRPPDVPTRPVPYLSFPVDVGKNSQFQKLSEEHLLELGGVEYSALNALLWIVPLVSPVIPKLMSVLKCRSTTSGYWLSR